MGPPNDHEQNNSLVRLLAYYEPCHSMRHRFKLRLSTEICLCMLLWSHSFASASFDLSFYDFICSVRDVLIRHWRKNPVSKLECALEYDAAAIDVSQAQNSFQFCTNHSQIMPNCLSIVSIMTCAFHLGYRLTVRFSKISISLIFYEFHPPWNRKPWSRIT